MATPHHVRVFLSSPGDVAEERRAARELLDKLQDKPLLRGRLTVEVVAWDDPQAPAPMAANETPQQSVNRYSGRPADCDLTVVILWGRIGTPIPSDWRRADGSRYASGTVWEFDDAMQAGREVWVYRRTDVPRLELTDPELEGRRAQYAAVESFFAQFRNADGSLPRGCSAYASADEFRRLFAAHLESFARQRIEASMAEPAAQPAAAAAADLTISPLSGPRRVRALAGHEVIRRPGDAAPVYPGGLSLSFTLAHNGAGRQSVSLHAIELELLRYTPGPRDDLAYAVDGAQIQGAGVAQPHVFSIALQGGVVGPASWVLDARAGRVAVARSANFLDTAEPRVLTFPWDRGDVEEIQGTVLAHEAGLYEFRLVFGYSVGGVDRQQVSLPLSVYFDE